MNKELLDLILAQLAEDFPDTAKTYSAEVFADWLTDLSKQYMEAFNTPQRNSTIAAEFRRGGLRPIGSFQTEACHRRDLHGEFLASLKAQGLSPTGRRPSQPELQSLPSAPLKYGDFLEFGQPLVPFTDTEIEVVKQRAKELLQQYRDTFPVISAPWLTPGHYPNFPCVAVDLASGADYSFEQHPIQADHASIDDKGNVSVSGTFSAKGPSQNLPKYNPGRYMKEALFAPYTATAEQVVQQERSGANWSNMTPDDIYKDLAEAMKKVRTPAEQLMQHRLTQTWTISHGTTTISYAPNSAVDIPVLVVSELLDNGVVEVVESCQGEAAVKRARYYLERFEARMKR